MQYQAVNCSPCSCTCGAASAWSCTSEGVKHYPVLFTHTLHKHNRAEWKSGLEPVLRGSYLPCVCFIIMERNLLITFSEFSLSARNSPLLHLFGVSGACFFTSLSHSLF